MGCIREGLVGCQDAIASKPAPTVGMGACGEIGWMLGRRRQQAGSHSWNGCMWRDWLDARTPSPASRLPQLEWVHVERLVGCSDAIASKPAPTDSWAYLRETGRQSGRHPASRFRVPPR